MRRRIQFDRSILVWIVMYFFSCTSPAPVPSGPFFVLRTFYKTAAGIDLLNQSNSTAFKKGDLKVITRSDYNGLIKDVSFNDNENGPDLFFDDELRLYYLDLAVPTNEDKSPIATYITLSKSDQDTLTFDFGVNKFKHIPNKICYNKKMVWDVANAPDNGRFPPITIVK